MYEYKHSLLPRLSDLCDVILVMFLNALDLVRVTHGCPKRNAEELPSPHSCPWHNITSGLQLRTFLLQTQVGPPTFLYLYKDLAVHI